MCRVSLDGAGSIAPFDNLTFTHASTLDHSKVNTDMRQSFEKDVLFSKLICSMYIHVL